MFRSLRSLPDVIRASPKWGVAFFAAIPVVVIVLAIASVVSWGEVAIAVVICWAAVPVSVTRNYERHHGVKGR